MSTAVGRHRGAPPAWKVHRITGWNRPLRSSSPTIRPTTPCLLNHTPKCHIYTFFEHLQGWGLNHLPGQPVPLPDHSFSKDIFPNIQSKPPLKQTSPGCCFPPPSPEEISTTTCVAQSTAGKQNQQLVARVSTVWREEATSFLRMSMLGQIDSLTHILSPSHIPLQSQPLAPQRQLPFGAMGPSGEADMLTPQTHPSRSPNASDLVLPALANSAQP